MEYKEYLVKNIKNFGEKIMANYKSESKHLGDDDFFKKSFNIPIYQRLYVWENIQVKTLIDDLVRAYEHDAGHEYYLGGIVVVENADKFDLIDGQQRFTTLKILREILGETGFALNFIIRDDVWEHYNSKDNTDDIDIKRMREAKRELQAGLERLKDKDTTNFLKYLKEQVKLVVTTVPSENDLNKLFELINGRGEQLQQHEILKAKLLSRIKENRYEYGMIWDMCANMDDFLEINIKKSLNMSWKEHTLRVGFSDLCEKIIKKIKTVNNSNQEVKPTEKGQNTISHIINNGLGKAETSKENDKEDEASTQYLSIISFEMFLLYALVSFEDMNYFEKMKDKQIEFKDKNLIQIFETILPFNNEEEEVFKNFIQHMFSLRVLYDKWIIKNHKKLDDNSNETTHKISRVEKYENGENVSRQIIDLNNSDNLALLQSMLYHAHTRNTQEWIVPFLKNLENTTTIEDSLILLKDIDNVLYSQFDTGNTILERASKYSKYEKNIDCQKIIEYLSESDNKSYHLISHYWFYKMDWIIWDLSEKRDEKFKFTARNSIEHIGPQNPDDEHIETDKVSDDFRHSFGNLFLVSVSQNSSVGNKGFNVKKAMFLKDNKEIKNLKLSLLSEYGSWGDDGAKRHLAECIDKVQKYYQCHENSSF